MTKGKAAQEVLTKDDLMRMRVNGDFGDDMAGYNALQVKAVELGLVSEFSATDWRCMLPTVNEPNGRMPAEDGGSSGGYLVKAREMQPVRDALKAMAEKIEAVGPSRYRAALADRDTKREAADKAAAAAAEADKLVASFDRRVFVDGVRVEVEGERRWVFFRAVPSGDDGMAAEASSVTLDAAQVIPSAEYGHFDRSGAIVAKMTATSEGKAFNVTLPAGLGVYDSLTAAAKAAEAARDEDKSESDVSVRGTTYWRLLSVPAVDKGKKASGK